MKQAADQYTGELFTPRGRGRPRKPKALTPAQRARAYRARKKSAKTGDNLQWLRDAYAELCRDRDQVEQPSSNFRDASRKFDQVEEPWYFPGTAEWHAHHSATRPDWYAKNASNIKGP